jgi:hypothetical protein
MAAVLPKTDLKSQFVMIERVSKDQPKRYVCVNPNRARPWLERLVHTHDTYIKLVAEGKLKVDKAAWQLLGEDVEMAEVDDRLQDARQTEAHRLRMQDADETGLGHVSVQWVALQQFHTLATEDMGRLYIKPKEALKLQADGKVKVVTERGPRRQVGVS